MTPPLLGSLLHWGLITHSKTSANRSGKLISLLPPSKQGCKRATSAVDTGANAKKKKAEEEQESSEEEQEEKKSHKHKSREAKKTKKTTITSTEPVHLTRAEQALVDQGVSVAPPMRPRVTATVTTVASVTAASAPPVSVCPPVSAHQRRLEASTECAAAAFEDTNDVKADISNSDSSSPDDDTRSASNDSSVAGTESGTLPMTMTPGDSTPIDQRSEIHGTSLTNEDTPSTTGAPVTPPMIGTSVTVTEPAPVTDNNPTLVSSLGRRICGTSKDDLKMQFKMTICYGLKKITSQVAVPPPVSSKITASSATKASTSGAKSKKDELIELLKIDRDILESTDHGIRGGLYTPPGFT
ncbi:hypothetical protein DXG01_006068 [Tephrocybe rancida]|nr:hypothetical protein DXG01_006068 [Tephrocybe rancida]